MIFAVGFTQNTYELGGASTFPFSRFQGFCGIFGSAVAVVCVKTVSRGRIDEIITWNRRHQMVLGLGEFGLSLFLDSQIHKLFVLSKH